MRKQRIADSGLRMVKEAEGAGAMVEATRGQKPRSSVLLAAIRHPLSASIVAASAAVLVAPLWPSTATAAEMCYEDDVGRIVKRRRPGYTEVPCPEEGGVQRQAPAN